MRLLLASLLLTLSAGSMQAQGFNLDGLRLGMTQEQLWTVLANGPWDYQLDDREDSNVAHDTYELIYSGTGYPTLNHAEVKMHACTVFTIELFPGDPPDSNLASKIETTPSFKPDSGLSIEEMWRRTQRQPRTLALAIRHAHPQAAGPDTFRETSLDSMLTVKRGSHLATAWTLDHQRLEVHLYFWMVGSDIYMNDAVIKLVYEPPQRPQRVNKY